MGKKINWWNFPGTSDPGERIKDWRRRRKQKKSASFYDPRKKKGWA